MKMEKTYPKDCESCFVCSEYMGPFKNELSVVTGYSEKPISEILGIYPNELSLLFFNLSKTQFQKHLSIVKYLIQLLILRVFVRTVS